MLFYLLKSRIKAVEKLSQFNMSGYSLRCSTSYIRCTTYHWYQPLHVSSVSSGQLMCFTYCGAQVFLAGFFITSKDIKSGNETRWGSGHTVYIFWPLNGCALSYLPRQIILIHLSAFSMNIAAGFSMFFTRAFNLSKTTFWDIAS